MHLPFSCFCPALLTVEDMVVEAAEEQAAVGDVDDAGEAEFPEEAEGGGGEDEGTEGSPPPGDGEERDEAGEGEGEGGYAEESQAEGEPVEGDEMDAEEDEDGVDREGEDAEPSSPGAITEREEEDEGDDIPLSAALRAGDSEVDEAAASPAPAPAPAPAAVAGEHSTGASPDFRAPEERPSPPRAHFAVEEASGAPSPADPEDYGSDDAFEDEVLTSMVDPRFAEAVAHRIEGFHDDFRTGETDNESEDGEDEEELTLDEAILEAKVKREQLLDLNTVLQAKLARYLAELRSRVKGSTLEFSIQKDGTADTGMAIKMGGLMTDEDRMRIQELLDEWERATDELVSQEHAHERQVYELETRLEERKEKAAEVRNGYREFAMEVARGAEHSRTGRSIPGLVLRDMEAADMEKTDELEGLRLKHILLRNRLQKLEQRVRQREQLAEGLMLIDFEQLKIENQSLNEKIEERNEELTKLNRKCQATIQVITHVKEKLQFLEKDNDSLVGQLADLDERLNTRREVLQDLKTERQKLRNQVQRIRDRNTTIANPVLLEDFEGLRVKKANLENELATLHARHRLLQSRIKTAGTRSRMMSMKSVGDVMT